MLPLTWGTCQARAACCAHGVTLAPVCCACAGRFTKKKDGGNLGDFKAAIKGKGWTMAAEMSAATVVVLADSAGSAGAASGVPCMAASAFWKEHLTR